MHKILAIALLFVTVSVKAQDKHALDSVDKLIISTIINPAEREANVDEPNWTAIGVQVRASYTEVQADRAITKAQIYYYYNKDWPKFSTAIVHFTNAYEDKDDLKLLNKNAGFILEHSTDQSELKAAQGWMKHAVDKEPSNTTYQETYKALTAKIQ
jgi:hypothetical protein